MQQSVRAKAKCYVKIVFNNDNNNNVIFVSLLSTNLKGQRIHTQKLVLTNKHCFKHCKTGLVFMNYAQ